jgi:hypothetical protein
MEENGDVKWKEIPGFENYEASTLGQVKNKKTKRILKPGSNGKYQTVFLWKKRKLAGCKYIHRLVLMTFVGQPTKEQECAHLDGNRNNNILSNLRWVTAEENNQHKFAHGTIPLGNKHKNCKIKDEKIPFIFSLFFDGHNAKRIGELFLVSECHISHILSGMARKHLQYCPAVKVLVKELVRHRKAKRLMRNRGLE